MNGKRKSNTLWDEVLRAIKDWREQGYPDVTATTKRLLEYWFYEDHRFPDGTPFEFWCCQREAIEALIYIYEVCEYRSLYELSRGFNMPMSFDATEDNWPKYCFKMATGSGKTFVMALAIVWQYFNRLKEYRPDSTTNFLIISPNLIVLDRLLEGFKHGGLFQDFPFFIPEEWRADFEMQIIKQSENVPPHSMGILHITNRHQLYERERRGSGEGNPVNECLRGIGGPKPTTGEEFKERIDLMDVLLEYDNLVVLNDEAHHAHLDSKWYEAIGKLAEEDKLLLQLDFTATAWDISQNQDVPLPHIVYNYPLKRAIEDEIVKQPRIVEIVGEPLPTSDDFVRQYQAQIHTADQYLEERKEDLEDVDEKPVLFVMCDNTDHADDVAEYFANDLGYGDKVLLIHTYLRKGKYGYTGDVRREDLKVAREAAREIDDNKYEVIVSVLMLTEGWDVRNVCIILPLRAFGSNVLTEQTLGRGLRKMFPHQKDVDDDLFVIEHPSFIDLWEEKIEQEELPSNIIVREGEHHRESHKISVDESKLEYNFSIPKTKGGISSVTPDLSEIDLDELPQERYSLDEIDVVDAKAIERKIPGMEPDRVKDLEFEFAPRIQEYFAYLTKSVLDQAGSSSQFAQLYPLIRDYTLNHFFKEKITDIDDDVISKLNTLEIRNELYDIFIKKLHSLSKVEKRHEIISYYDLRSTDPFHTTKDVYGPKKSVFNLLPWDSPLEREFMKYLDRSSEVDAYTKIFWRIPIHIPYFYEKEGLKHYLPDFVVKTEDDQYYLVETKGAFFDLQETVPIKADVGETWCQTITESTGTKWTYVKITSEIFNRNKNQHFKKLVQICHNQ